MSHHLTIEQRLILVTGPARSGKSEWAEWLARQSGKSVTYVATALADPQDREWQNRIEQHQKRRPAHWQTLQIPLALAPVLQTYGASSCLLIDSLGTWLANCLELDEESWQARQQELLTSLTQTHAQVILVAEETGWGVVPAYPVGRTFRDRLGGVVRSVGAIADVVYLVTGGYALPLTTLGTSLSTILPPDANL